TKPLPFNHLQNKKARVWRHRGPFAFNLMRAGYDATAWVFAVALETLFLLPGGRPRRGLPVSSAIQAGGRPRRGPRPRARRSRLSMASSICSLSDFNSARILLTSIEGLRPAVALMLRPINFGILL